MIGGFILVLRAGRRRVEDVGRSLRSPSRGDQLLAVTLPIAVVLITSLGGSNLVRGDQRSDDGATGRYSSGRDAGGLASEPQPGWRRVDGPSAASLIIPTARLWASAPGPLSAVLPSPDRVQDVGATDIGSSPSYDSDHTVLMTGVFGGCTCYYLFRSQDSGRNWSLLPGGGLAGGRLLLPPTGFREGRFYAFGARGLQMTHDGGMSFQTRSRLGVGYPAVLPPGSGAEVTVSNVTLLAFGESGPPVVLGAFGPGYQAAGAPLFIGDSPGTLVALQPVVGPPPLNQTVILRCGNGTCGEPVSLPWSGPTNLARVPSRGDLGERLIAFGTGGLAISADGGQSFSLNDFAAGRTVQDLIPVSVADGAVRLMARTDSGDGLTVYVSDDLGQQWYRAAGLAGPVRLLDELSGPSEMAVIRRGSVSEASSVICSSDAGAQWASC